MIDAPMGGVQRFSYNRCDPHVAQPHNRAIRINRNLKDAVIVKEPAIVRVDGRKKDLLTCGDASPGPPEASCATGRDLSEKRSWSRIDQVIHCRIESASVVSRADLQRSIANFARQICLNSDTFASFALVKFAASAICGDLVLINGQSRGNLTAAGRA